MVTLGPLALICFFLFSLAGFVVLAINDEDLKGCFWGGVACGFIFDVILTLGWFITKGILAS